MTETCQCPRCGQPVLQLADASWWCSTHGPVAALWPVDEPSAESLRDHLEAASVPTWLPWPMPTPWSVAGVVRAGDPDVQATALACAAPDPVGGVADVVIVCEEPGVGLGARYAGLPTLDVGREISGSPPTTKVHVAGHATPLWWVGADTERDAFVGEASGRWLWVIAWPGSAGALLAEMPTLVDLHELHCQLELVPVSVRSPRLRS